MKGVFRQRARLSGASASDISSSISDTKSGPSASTHEPGLSTFPVTARKQQMARCVGATFAPTWSTPRPDTSAAAPARPNRRAARTMSSSGRPHTAATCAGV